MSVVLASPEPVTSGHPEPVFPHSDPVILGCATLGQLIPDPVIPGPGSLFAPRGACVLADGSVWVSDSGHHRVLGWQATPRDHAAPADVLLGQADWEGEAPNGGGRVPASSGLNLPVGITAVGNGLAVADAWNHRVLIWKQVPRASHVPPDLVLGQPDPGCRDMNRGCAQPSASSMYWPFSVYWDGESLFVADTGNRRVLIWDGLPGSHGQAADRVLGQTSFTVRDEGAGKAPGRIGMRWPHSVCCWKGHVCVADAGSSRIMIWESGLPESGSPANWFLGQPDAHSDRHNGGALDAGQAVMNMPYGVSAAGDWLFVADTANSRALAWHIDALQTGANAGAVFGQTDWIQRGENRWQTAEVDTLCWPYGMHAREDVMAIADTGNHRVLLMPRS